MTPSSVRFMKMDASSEASDGKGYASFAEEDALISDITSVSMYGRREYMKLPFEIHTPIYMHLHDEDMIPTGLRLGKQRAIQRESRFVTNAYENKVEAVEKPYLEGVRRSTALLLISITPTSSYLGFAYNWYNEGNYRTNFGLLHPLSAFPPLLP